MGRKAASHGIRLRLRISLLRIAIARISSRVFSFSGTHPVERPNQTQ